MLQETVAKILIFNENDEVLVLQTGEYAAHPEKEHKPDLPGGIVDAGESERDAVIREVYEEARVILDKNAATLAYSETKSYASEGKSVTKLLYIARIDNTPAVTISCEHESYGWVPITSLLKSHEFRPFYKEAIEYIQNNQLV